MDGVPIKIVHSAGVGAVNTKRIKPRHDKSVNPEEPQSCTLCDKPGNRNTGNYERKKYFGSMVSVSDIDQLVNKLTRPTSPDLNTDEEIPVGSHVFKKVNMETNYILMLIPPKLHM